MKVRGMQMGIRCPELRRDPVTGIWSILAVGRSRRPGATMEAEKKENNLCPFCPGHEHLTPPAVWIEGGEDGDGNSPAWKIRIIPNLYPALYPEIEGRGWRRGARRGMPAQGYHEVIVHSPDHYRSLAEMEPEEAVGVMWAYRTRYRHLEPLATVRQVMIILNRGREAGASLEHPHTQVFAIPLVPRVVRDELREARRFKGCPLCTAAVEAVADGRLVAENKSFVAFTPYASRFPYETWFAPRLHRSDFDKVDDSELKDMAELIHTVLRGFSRLLDDPPYNLFIRSAPCDGGSYDYYHWRVVLIPRITREGGFELSSDIYINITSPDEAAAQLRDSIK
jgi:UDPglucose--hexose-1-phosphate uridylyltransferase